MKKIVSFRFINLEFVISLIIFIVIYIYEFSCVSFCNTVSEKKLLGPLLYYFGNIFNFIPMLIVKSNTKMTNTNKNAEMERRNSKIISYIYEKPYIRYLEKKDIVIIVIVSFLVIIKSGCKIIEDTIVKTEPNLNNIFNNKYKFVDFLMIYLFSRYALNIRYYKHQIMSFIGISIIGAIRYIYIQFFINENTNKTYELLFFFIKLLIGVFEAIYYGYVKGLMQFKYLSPYKCSFIFGIINTPIILIIYFIISFIDCPKPFCNDDNDGHFDTIMNIFTKLEIHEYFILIIYIFLCGIDGSLINIVMNDFTIYHILIPHQMQVLIGNIIEFYDFEKYPAYNFIIILILFFIELLMYLIFLEVIELNFCDLNKDTKKNIAKRAISDISYEDNRDTYLDIYYEGDGQKNSNISQKDYKIDEENNDDNDNSHEKDETNGIEMN